MKSIKSIWENQKPTLGIIQKSRIDQVHNLYCYAGTNNITGQFLFIISVSGCVVIPDLKNYRFKGVEIFTVEVEDRLELNIYLLDNELKDVFLLFIQDIVEEIQHSVTEEDAINEVFGVVSKWKKLFDKVVFDGLSIEQQKGLIGELLFLNCLLSNEETAKSAVQSWTSAEQDYQAKDYIFGSVGIEIKFTSAKQPAIKISNERQLETDGFSKVFLILYSAEAVKDNGVSLRSLVEQTRRSIASEEELRLFDAKLQLRGYFDGDKEQYGRMYSVRGVFPFSVTSDFPRIVKSNLPLGIYDASYSIEVSAVESFLLELEEVLRSLK